MNNDHLFRVSIKAVIHDESGRVLIVRERNDPYWNLPGGGMDYGETFEQALGRELFEEIGYEGAFEMKLRAAEDAKLIREDQPLWQLRLIYDVITENKRFSVGTHASEIKFVDPLELKESVHEPERRLYTYRI